MAGFYYEKFATWRYTDGHPEKAFTKDEILDAITLYWLTNTDTSSSRSYWDAAQLGEVRSPGERSKSCLSVATRPAMRSAKWAFPPSR